MASRSFNGKQYRRITGYKNKSEALKAARENRKGSWYARVVKEGDSWSLYTRKKLR